MFHFTKTWTDESDIYLKEKHKLQVFYNVVHQLYFRSECMYVNNEPGNAAACKSYYTKTTWDYITIYLG